MNKKILYFPRDHNAHNVGHLIPAGTGLRQYEKIVVGIKEEYERLMASKEEIEEEA